ncbi:BadF/BadG/BcrA/BcrD ATPase family protein [Amycolatopsis rhabdoformis]|uniref:BadF/BadG/BcrA/BcrD ATPase family protein n=1 Tax=Amycolatopsis rhabdoformis TaxID=1448059 RepID=A0ABZ1I1F3_9PSEU|nr:BadF/BadG/BcrA/BcrD ATPase family protein [Amycolatopsis rhabdoformis]WSE27611.1 BadF/BadG/BcrA/BcrD ATPase family protein [Amycolatopsis rhabdoformis]
MSLVVGVDAGGTSTRAIVVDATGAVLGSATAGGANPNSHPPAEAAARIASAIETALGGRTGVRAAVVGLAGVSKLSDPAVAAVFAQAWQRIGLAGAVRTVADAEVAYASATSAPDGTVLVAGTGSIAGRIRARRMTGTAGGYGWLLGDEGSAFWLGREAVRSTLEALGRGPELGGLAAAVLAEAFGPSAVDAREGAPEAALEVRREPLTDSDRTRLDNRDFPNSPVTEANRLGTARALITKVNAEPPIRLARFAPLVSAAAAAGEPVADEIVTRAAELLVATALATRDPGEKTPVVLVGSVLTGTGPVGPLVRAGLAGLDVLTSSDGVLGAAWLAAVDAWGEAAARPSGR